MSEQIAAVRRMQNYIAEHLYEEITPACLAKASNYSPWHSYRLFCKVLSVSPSDYVRRLRLSKSALLLRDEKVKIIDVAFTVGFNSVDGYQRAFYREFGCNPREYALNPVPIYLFTPYEALDLKKNKEKTMEKVQNVFIQVVEKPQRKVIIKRGKKATEYFEYCNEVGCDIWGLLVSMSKEPVSMWLPEKYVEKDTSKYVQGVEVELDYNGVIPGGFDVITLPSAKYLRFQGEPFKEEDYEAAINALQEAIKKFNPKTIGFSWDTENPRIQLEPRGERGYIELLAIK